MSQNLCWLLNFWHRHVSVKRKVLKCCRCQVFTRTCKDERIEVRMLSWVLHGLFLIVKFLPLSLFRRVCKEESTKHFASATCSGVPERRNVSKYECSPEFYIDIFWLLNSAIATCSGGVPVRRNVSKYKCCPEFYIDFSWMLNFCHCHVFRRVCKEESTKIRPMPRVQAYLWRGTYWSTNAVLSSTSTFSDC